MLIKGITDEDFLNYKVPSMFIITSFCTFKCDKENGVSCCQNSSLANQPAISIPNAEIIERYLKNKITHAIVFGGLEPIEQISDIVRFIHKLRTRYNCDDTVVIYTGFNRDEIPEVLERLSAYKNIIVKFGRFIPNSEMRFDDILGVKLASPNQYAEVIS